jgi:predicted O-linked N-acetylglucosamine transferase (SPINDLY family)
VYAVGPRHPGSDPEAFLSGVEHLRSAPQPFAAWEETILADGLDVLIYPEIGMGCDSLALASRRLAPVQCAAWGHPETTGLPTMDYFLSSELMEPADAAQHYSERLVLLPHLSIWYEPPCRPSEADGMDRRRLGLGEEAFVFSCTQATCKYLPRYDDVFPRIAARAPEVQFLFVEHPTSRKGTEIFKQRLEAAFAKHGLEAGRHCVFSPRLAPEAYLAMQRHVDAALDSIGWSGGVSLLEALADDLPVVTLPVGLMRGRHGAAFLRRMGLAHRIASTLDDYVASAARLARDKDFHRQARGEVARCKHRLYRDAQAIQGLEAFLARVAGRAGAP